MTEIPSFWVTLRRVILGAAILVCLFSFIIWRVDNPRMERFRMAIVDRVVPDMQWAMAPVHWAVEIGRDLQSYDRLLEQNAELRRELRNMEAWREAAIQLEQENARLLALNNMQLSPRLTSIGGEVITDSGSPFRQSVLLNIGAEDQVQDGWAVTDGMGLVGRISGVGERTSRVILLTDSNSRVPAVVRPSGQLTIVEGDNTAAPPLTFVDKLEDVQINDRVFTTGDGGVFPPDLLIGFVVQGGDGRMRLRMSADYRRLEYVRVLRHRPAGAIDGPGGLILGATPVMGPIPEQTE